MSARVHRYPPHLGSTRAAENAWQSAHAFQFPAVVALGSSRCLRHVLILLSSKLHLMGVEMASSVVRSTGGVEVAGLAIAIVTTVETASRRTSEWMAKRAASTSRNNSKRKG